jgi:hypothetical protein
MFLTCAIPWLICVSAYTLLYFTYPKDRKVMRAIMLARARAEGPATGPAVEEEAHLLRSIVQDDPAPGSDPDEGQ